MILNMALLVLVGQTVPGNKTTCYIDQKFYINRPYYKRRWPNAATDPFEAADLINDTVGIIGTIDEEKILGDQIKRDAIALAIRKLAMAGNHRAISYAVHITPGLSEIASKDEMLFEWKNWLREHGDAFEKLSDTKKILDPIERKRNMEKYNKEIEKLIPGQIETCMSYLAKQTNKNSKILVDGIRGLNMEWVIKLAKLNTPSANYELWYLAKKSGPYGDKEPKSWIRIMTHSAENGEWRAMLALASYYGNRLKDYNNGWYWIDRAKKETGMGGIEGYMFVEGDPWPRPTVNK